MALAKWWDGSVWQRLLSLGAGGTPSRSWYPPRPQPGSVTDQGTANIGNVNQGASGVYLIGNFVPRQTFEATNDQQLFSAVWAGAAGGADLQTYSATQPVRDGTRIEETGYPVFAHANYWVPLFHVATLRAQAGGEYNAWRYEVHKVSGPGVLFTGGGVNWLQTVA